MKRYFDNQPPAGDPRTAIRAPTAMPTRMSPMSSSRSISWMSSRTRSCPHSLTPGGPQAVCAGLLVARSGWHAAQSGDSPGALVPGINGPTVRAALHNVDDNLRQLRDYLHVTPDPHIPGKTLEETTDIFITSDHGSCHIEQTLPRRSQRANQFLRRETALQRCAARQPATGVFSD